MQMLGSAKARGDDDRDPAEQRERPANSGASGAAKKPATGGSGFDDFEDDIPF